MQEVRKFRHIFNDFSVTINHSYSHVDSWFFSDVSNQRIYSVDWFGDRDQWTAKDMDWSDRSQVLTFSIGTCPEGLKKTLKSSVILVDVPAKRQSKPPPNTNPDATACVNLLCILPCWAPRHTGAEWNDRLHIFLPKVTSRQKTGWGQETTRLRTECLRTLAVTRSPVIQFVIPHNDRDFRDPLALGHADNMGFRIENIKPNFLLHRFPSYRSITNIANLIYLELSYL
jgi:hypothetical protein